MRNTGGLGAPWRDSSGAREDVEGIELAVVGGEGGGNVGDVAVSQQLLQHGTLGLIQRLRKVNVVNELSPDILDSQAGSNGMSSRTRERHRARDGQVGIGRSHREKTMKWVSTKPP